MRDLVAIPGQPGLAAAMPANAPDRALAGVTRLAASIARREVFGFLDLACRATWYEPGCVLTVLVDYPTAWRLQGASSARCIEWRWSVLIARADGGYEDGWHPCAVFLGLTPDWQHALRGAVSGR